MVQEAVFKDRLKDSPTEKKVSNLFYGGKKVEEGQELEFEVYGNRIKGKFISIEPHEYPAVEPNMITHISLKKETFIKYQNHIYEIMAKQFFKIETTTQKCVEHKHLLKSLGVSNISTSQTRTQKYLQFEVKKDVDEDWLKQQLKHYNLEKV